MSNSSEVKEKRKVGRPTRRSSGCDRHRLLHGEGRLEDLPGVAEVAGVAELHHGGPGGGDQTAGARALHARRGVLPAAPVGQVEVLRVAQRLGAEAEHRRALEGVPVLVGVGRHGGDAGDRVVERRDVVAQLPAEGQDEPAEAGVDVEADAALERQVGQVTDRVDGAVAVVAGRPDRAPPSGRPRGRAPSPRRPGW